MSSGPARLRRAPLDQLAGERDLDLATLLDSVESLMTGQMRMEQLLEKLVTETAANQPGPPRCRSDSSLAAAFPVRGTEKHLVLESTRAPEHYKVVEPDDDSPREADSSLRRLEDESPADKRTTGEGREFLPVWFETIEMREELKGDEQQLWVEAERSHSLSPRHRSHNMALALASSDPREAAGLHRTFVMTPHSPMRLIFDLVGLVVLAYDLVSVPLLVAFDIRMNVLRWLSIASIAYWACDIIMNFRTGFYANGELEMRAGNIALHYFKGSFGIDCCLVLLDVLDITSLSQANSFKFLRIFKVTRLLRLASLLRMRRIRPFIEWLAANHATGLMRVPFFVAELCSFLAVFMWLNHLLACLWIFLARTGDDHSDTGVSWLDQTTGDREYRGHRHGYQYSTALHWAITQMTPGSMQVFPQNTSERVYNIVCLVAGLVIFSTIISSISARVTNFRIQMQSIRTKMDELTGFLERSRVRGELRLAVCRQVDMRLHETRPVGVKDLDVLSLLSISLRQSLQLELCDPHLLEHPYLTFVAEADHATWKDVCMKCVDFNMLMRKDTLFVHGTQAAAMHFVTMGRLSYSPEPAFCSLSREDVSSEDIAEVEPGKSLSEAALWCRWRHVGTAEVLNIRHCEVLTLNAEKVLKALTSDPLVRQVTWAYGLSFFTFLKGCKPPVSPPNDLTNPFGVDEVIASMPKAATILCGQVAIKILRQKPETLFSWARTVREDNTEQLINEVNSGGSTLLATKRQGVVRCVPLLLIRITRADMRMLVRLRLIVKADGSPEATCKLPGGRQEAGEHPDACLSRLLQDKLRPLKEGVHVEGVEKRSQTENSRKFGVPTRYVRTVISADWKDTADEELSQHLVEEAKRLMPRVNSEARQARAEGREPRHLDPPEVTYVPADVYSFPGRDVYAWLTQEEYSYFDSARGQKCLFQWLRFLDGGEVSHAHT